MSVIVLFLAKSSNILQVYFKISAENTIATVDKFLTYAQQEEMWRNVVLFTFSSA